jgi:hypothetical protein
MATDKDADDTNKNIHKHAQKRQRKSQSVAKDNMQELQRKGIAAAVRTAPIDLLLESLEMLFS